jgi:hypothetical protein
MAAAESFLLKTNTRQEEGPFREDDCIDKGNGTAQGEARTLGARDRKARKEANREADAADPTDPSRGGGR